MFCGVPPSVGGLWETVPALLPWILLLMVLASSMICSETLVMERKLTILVDNGFRFSNNSWRSPVTVSKLFLAVITLLSSVLAEVNNVPSERMVSGGLGGL